MRGLLAAGNPYGVLALTAVAAAVCLPATQIKNLYGISVGYGLSVATIGLYLCLSFETITPVLLATIFYGCRLALHLFVRDVSGYRTLSTDDEPPRLKRIPFALSLSLFYAFMCTPLLYGCRAPVAAASTTTLRGKVNVGGAVLAWFGALLEAIADLHKFVTKVRNNEKANNRTEYGGPSGGVYRFTRHPNYTGEIAFWCGVYLSGAPSFGPSVIAWLCGTLGLFGIYSIMSGASKKLEEKQAENYGGQPAYDDWKKKSPFPLIPFVT